MAIPNANRSLSFATHPVVKSLATAPAPVNFGTGPIPAGAGVLDTSIVQQNGQTVVNYTTLQNGKVGSTSEAIDPLFANVAVPASQVVQSAEAFAKTSYDKVTKFFEGLCPRCTLFWTGALILVVMMVAYDAKKGR